MIGTQRLLALLTRALEADLPADDTDAGALEEARRFGLLVGEEQLAITDAGRQFVACGGDVPHATLTFLPQFVDDLEARGALLGAGVRLVRDFREALLAGDGRAHARSLAPPAFKRLIDQPVALDLYAAAVALLARLSEEAPAGCVAEEVMSVALMAEAVALLEADGQLDPEQAQHAIEALEGLYELFEDADVLGLYGDLDEAAAAGSFATWFAPFGTVHATGYLSD